MLCAVDLVLDDDRELVRFVAYEDVEVAPLALHLCVSKIPHIQVDRETKEWPARAARNAYCSRRRRNPSPNPWLCRGSSRNARKSE